MRVVRAAILASGDGGRLQAILDAMYFKEIPEFELVAVICPRREDYAMTRAANAGVPAYVVDPELFPNMTLGVVPYQFRNHIIGTYPALSPAFEDVEGDVNRAVLERGVKVTGATAYFADGDGGVGGIILQKAIDVLPDDTPESLGARVMEECEWKLLSRAVALYCGGKLSVHGKRVIVAE